MKQFCFGQPYKETFDPDTLLEREAGFRIKKIPMSPSEKDHSGEREMGRAATPGGKTGRKATPGGETEPSRPASKSLPPCRVCDGPGAGLHYGVNTCDPCKAFYRRTLTGTKPLRCHGSVHDDGRCVIGLSKAAKNPCSYCRLKKCQAVGMSKSAIRLGRYTLAKKTRDTIELKAGHGEEKPRDNDRLDDFAKTVIAAQKSTLEFMYHKPGYGKIDEIKSQVTEELLHLPEQHAPLDSQTFLQLYRQGMEPDCRMNNIKIWMEYLAVACKHFVMFLQEIPGFKDLPHEDKQALAKSAFLEIDMMNHHQLACHRVNAVLIPYDGAYVPMFLDNIFGKELAHYINRLTNKMKQLNLTPEELCLMKVLSIFATERSCFKDPKGIDSVRQACLESLYQVISGCSKTDRDLRFSKIIDILQYAATTAHYIENFVQTSLIHYASEEPIASETPALTREMFFD